MRFFLLNGEDYDGLPYPIYIATDLVVRPEESDVPGCSVSIGGVHFDNKFDEAVELIAGQDPPILDNYLQSYREISVVRHLIAFSELPIGKCFLCREDINTRAHAHDFSLFAKRSESEATYRGVEAEKAHRFLPEEPVLWIKTPGDRWDLLGNDIQEIREAREAGKASAYDERPEWRK